MAAERMAAIAQLCDLYASKPSTCILPLIGLDSNLSSSSSSEEESEDEDVCAFVAVSKSRKRLKIAKVECYVQNTVSRYSDFVFKAHFRLSRSTVQLLMEMLPPPAERKTGRPGLHETSRETLVLLSLWTLGNQESFRGIADRFNVGAAHAHREFVNFCDLVCGFRDQLIKWPAGFAAQQTMMKFSKLRGNKSFPDVIGCVDGTHVAISAPKQESDSYFNRKQFTSVLLQAVCDSELRFTDVFAGWPGSSHDARVWRNSPLHERILQQPDIIPDGAHLLGDSAHPLCTFLMAPYRDNGHLLRKEKHFNKCLSSTRVVIEQAYGHLFGRFRRLKYLHMLRLDRIASVIVTGCILHNLCVAESDVTPEEDAVVSNQDVVQDVNPQERIPPIQMPFANEMPSPRSYFE